MFDYFRNGLNKSLKLGATAVLVAGLSTVPRAGMAETLADALVGAYKFSGLLEQNRALLRAADEDVAGAAAALKPILNWSASLSRTFGDAFGASVFGRTTQLENTSASVGITAQMLLWDSGASALGVEVAKETVLATRENLTSIEQQILLRAVNAFFNVQRAREFVALRQNNLRLLGEELRAAQDRFEVGEVTRTDVALAQSQLAAARSGLATARGDLLQAEEEYANAVGRRPGALTTPRSLPGTGASLATAKALAVRVHPDLRAAQHQVAAAELSVSQSGANMSPTLNAVGSLSVTENFNSDNYNHNGSIGLAISGPIYRGGALSSDLRQSMARRDAQRANLLTVSRNIQQNVGNAYAQVSATRASLSASEERIRAARIAFQGVREEATLGARTTLDVLDAEQELLDAETARISARSDLYIAAYTVLFTLGQLTARDLNLGVQQYDPAAYYNAVKNSPPLLSKEGRKLDRVLRALQKD